MEQVKELLQNAGINADVQSREDRYQGIVVHTDAPREEVEKVFGEEYDWNRNRFNIIGTYTAHDDAPLRPPYTNVKTYSWYDVFTNVPEVRLNAFNVPDVGYTYRSWHSIKYNTV